MRKAIKGKFAIVKNSGCSFTKGKRYQVYFLDDREVIFTNYNTVANDISSKYFKIVSGKLRKGI